MDTDQTTTIIEETVAETQSDNENVATENAAEADTAHVEQETTTAATADTEETTTQTATGQGNARETTTESLNHAAEIERIRREARVQAIVDTVGTNPYTNNPIKTEADVEEYALMRRIESEGKDPITDYHEYVKRQKAEQEQAATKVRTDRESAVKYIDDFKTAYPDVDLQKLAKDTDFDDFAQGKIGTEPLANIYSRYLAFRDRIAGKREKEIAQRAVSERAKENAAVGSLSDSTDASQSDVYTREQLDAMSQKDMEQNWDKVVRSMERLNKTN